MAERDEALKASAADWTGEERRAGTRRMEDRITSREFDLYKSSIADTLVRLEASIKELRANDQVDHQQVMGRLDQVEAKLDDHAIRLDRVAQSWRTIYVVAAILIGAISATAAVVQLFLHFQITVR